MTKNFNILFYIRKDKISNGLAPIYCRVTVNGKRSEIALKRSVLPSKWNSANGHLKGTTEEVKSLNSYIDVVKGKIYDHHMRLIQENQIITAETIKNSFLGLNQESKSLFSIFEEHNKKVKSLVNSGFAPGTLQRYETVFKHLKEFVQLKHKLSDYYIKDVDNEFINEFDYFLRSTRNCENNTTVKYIKNFKKIIRLALGNGWLNRDPFINYKVSLQKVDRGFLTSDELKTIVDKEFTIKRLDQVKDIFVFQCFTGLAFSDVKNLTNDQIVKGIDGGLWISTHRQKTDTNVDVPLLPEALAIIEKYKTDPYCIAKGVLLPVSSNQKMNSYLKEIGDLCSINKRISSHLARHTFATTVTLANGISLEVVSKMLGHTSLNTTKIYARLMNSRVSEEMKTLKGKFITKPVTDELLEVV